jgi:metallo-beta-lactamase class B
MRQGKRLSLAGWTAGIVAAFAGGAAWSQTAPDHPAITFKGETYTPALILSRNMGTPEDRVMQFPPHRIIGNVYYVGTDRLSSFLIVTPAGNILIDTTYERTVPVVEKSVADLGFKFSDIKIVLGTHAHGDHMEGDALVKELTGAQFVAMAEDVPALRAMKPGGKEHPIDRIIHDGDMVSLGAMTLTAHLTAGHTRGCTTWTFPVSDGGKSYHVMVGCSLRSPAKITPEIAAEFDRTFRIIRTLPCDVQLGDHGSQYRMQEKYAKLKAGGPNPFIDPFTCFDEAGIEEAMYHAILAEQGGPKE